MIIIIIIFITILLLLFFEGIRYDNSINKLMLHFGFLNFFKNIFYMLNVCC